MPAEYGSFGPYILFKKILEDELGSLYRAGELDRDSIRRTVLLRVFDGEAVPAGDVLSRVDTANRVAAVLKATNVAPGSTFFAHDSTPAMACDYIPGQPLGRIFAKVREEGFPVPVDNALLILEKLALALSAALAVELEGTSLVHGFLHPGLAVITNDGEGLVAGFGLADQLTGVLDDPQAAAMSEPYLAPEVLMSRNPSKRGDVYSLGAILYHLLTGKMLPTDVEAREGALDAAELAYDGEPVPDDIKILLVRALARKPEERFSSAADFKKELDKLLYGGAYSPTTFNLALFMDRLFRTEVENEDKDRAVEAEVDVQAYLKPEPEPEPEIAREPAASGGSKGLWIGVAIAVVAIGITVGTLVVPRLTQPPPLVIPPTPTAEEIAAKQQADEQRMRALIDAQVSRVMDEQEERMRSELLGRQKKIEDLQRQLRAAERASKGVDASAEAQREAQREAEEIKRRIAAEEQAKREREQELQAERDKAAVEARKQAEEAAQKQPTPEPEVASQQPTGVPAAAGQAASPTPPPVQVKENQYVDPSQVSTPPEVLKKAQVIWSPIAARSRRRGVVIVQATVNATGRVEEAKILRADETGFGIPESALTAARDFVFKPATKGGVRVKTHATITFPYNFALARRP